MNNITRNTAQEHCEVFHRPQVVLDTEFDDAVRISVETTFALSHDRKLSSREVGVITRHAADIARFKQARRG